MIEIFPDITSDITSDSRPNDPISFNADHEEGDLVGFDFYSSICVVGVQYIFALIYFMYKLANLAHPKDTDFGNSWFAKITVYIGMVLTLTGIIYVQIDLIMTKSTLDFQEQNQLYWTIIISI